MGTIASKEWVKSLLSKMNIGKYSTEEQRIGTWIDGKPLYRKVFTNFRFPSTSNGSMKDNRYDISALNIDNIIKTDVSLKMGNAYQSLTYLTNSGYQIKFQYLYETKEFELLTNCAGTENALVVTILEYTKTTD